MFDKQTTILPDRITIHSHFKELSGNTPPSHSFFLQKEYLEAVEEAAIPGVEYRYIPYLKQGKVEGLYYFQIINLSAQELGQIVHFEPYNKLLSGLSMLLQNLLFGVKKDKPHYLIISGSMCLSGDYGIGRLSSDDKSIYANFPHALAQLRHELERNGKVVAEIIKDFPVDSDPLHTILKPAYYHHLAMDPIMKMAIRPEWGSISDYVDALSSKYRQRFNQAKKKLGHCEVRTLDTPFIIENRERINELYTAVQEKSPVRIIKPDVNYIISLSKHLGEKVDIRGLFYNNELIAFLIGIQDEDHFEAHHIGIDYHHNKEFSLYLNILYLYIEMAIDVKARGVSFGRTALEMKTTVGAVSYPYNAYIKLNNRLLNGVLKKLLPENISEDWIPRDPFRQ